VAPLAVSVAEVPAQTVAELTVTVGLMFTVTVVVLLPEQDPSVPLTVYTDVAVGVTVIAFAFEPVFHV
jgi:hypothetical protein